MHIGSLGRQVPLVLRGHAQKTRVLAARRQMGLAVFARLLHGLLRPHATHHVISLARATHQIHGQDGVFSNGPTLQEQHCVVVWHPQQVAQQVLGLRQDVGEFGAPMAHFHHRHARQSCWEN